MWSPRPTTWILYWMILALTDFNQVKSKTLDSPVLQPQTSANLKMIGSFSTDPDFETLKTYSGVTQNIGLSSTKHSAYSNNYTDPYWKNQWFMHDYRVEAGPVMDHNIVPVYNMGFTGAGIKIAVVDDGFEVTHPDIKDNIVKSLSYDVCLQKPYPWSNRKDKSKTTSHGTKVAGVIAMKQNNDNCGVGVAYGAKIGVIKKSCGKTNEYFEALGLYYKQDEFDISNNSWGPEDNGKDIELISRVIEKTLHRGIKRGRGGKGIIFVFPSGNGRHHSDNCGWDQMVNQPGVIVIAAATNTGKVTYYAERCAGVMATTYSGAGLPGSEDVVTTDVDNTCIKTFFATSAAVPVASGIFALVLQANSSLTYRDMMHIVTMGSEVAPLADNVDTWYRNGKGFWVSNDFGFGLLNAKNMVNLALSWVNVPKEKVCQFTIQLHTPIPLTPGDMETVTFDTDACKGTPDEVNYLETVEVYVKVDYSRRGDLALYLKSPSKTGTTLLEFRNNDRNKDGMDNWRLKATHYWGENPRGSWTIEVATKPRRASCWQKYFGYVHQFTFIFRGTVTPPFHYRRLPRKYAGFRLPNGQTSVDN